MENKKRKKKTLLIVVAIIAALIMTVIIMMVVHNIQAKKRAGEYAKYELIRNTTMEKLIEHCDMEADKIDKIKISIPDAKEKGVGYMDTHKNPEGQGVYYIIDDEEIIEEIMAKLKDIRLYAAKYSVDEIQDSTSEWDIELHMNDKEYCISIGPSRIEGNDDIESLMIGTYNAKFPIGSDEFPHVSMHLWTEKALIYNEELIDYIYDIQKKYIRYLTIEDVVSIYEGGDMEDFFAYENDGGISVSMEEFDYNFDTIYPLTFTFPIEDFDGYILMKKNNSAVDGEDGKPVYYTDIVDVKLYNNDGESIDLLNTTKADLEAFMK